MPEDLIMLRLTGTLDGTAVAVSSIFVDACRKAGFQPRLVQEAKETSTLLSLVAAGMGVALVPMTSRLFSFQGVVFRPLRNPLPVDLAVAWNRNNETPLLRSFLTLFDSLPTFQPFGPGRLEIRDGAIRVRAVVGVGVQIDPYKLESYPYLTWQTTTNCTPCFPTCPCFGTWRSS